MKPSRLFALTCLLVLFALPANTKVRTSDHPGLRPAPDAKGKWGFINVTGRYRILPQFDGASEFSDGVAYIWVWNHWDKKVGIVDTGGKVTFFPPQEYEFTFHDGLARVQVYGPDEGPERSRTGFIDKTGRVVIKHQFSYAGDFSEGLAWVYAEGKNGKRYGFIDKTGRFAIDPQFDHQPGNFVEGLAKIDVDGKIGFIDRTGKFRIPAQFQQTDDSFSDGLMAAVPADGPARSVYINKDGKTVFEFPMSGWHIMAPFSEGLATFASFNQIGYVDKTGKTVIAPEFRGAKSFSEGLAAVRIIGNMGNYLWGYIDSTGKMIIEPQFFDAEPFAGGLARVTTVEGSRLLINKTGKTVWVLIK